MSVAAKGKKEEPEKKPRRRIKKVAGHGGHHGGSWKVAYADFVTAMMALFLVLWLLSQADTKLKESVANYFRSPGVFNSQDGGILGGPKKVSSDPSAEATEQNMFDEVASKLKKQLASQPEFSSYKDRVKVEVTDEGLRIQIIDKADRVTFESGSANLNPTARTVLTEIAKAICELPNPVAIGGHTDQHLFPQGSSYTNWELSADRANAARRTLESSCVKPEQIRRVVGYADTELLYPHQPFAAANRRINITVLRLHNASSTTNGKNPEVVEKATEKEPAEKDEENVDKQEKAGTKRSSSAAEEPAEEERSTAKEHAAEKPSAAKSRGTGAAAKAKQASH